MKSCWCGSEGLKEWGGGYLECGACGTLVYGSEVKLESLEAGEDESGYYGKNYWLEHQQKDFGYADIYTRARNDLTERNLHWLKALLKYRLPPGDVLELGCAHGSFVALLNQAGYQASGLEMSSWIVGYARKTFGIEVHAGVVEKQGIVSGSLDAIVLMDVLEHLPDPMGTMRYCLELLKPDGILLIQTPETREGASYRELTEKADRFLEMLIPREHLYLFSRTSVVELFKRLGAEHIEFEPAIFGHYDMFMVVSRQSLKTNGKEEIEQALLATPQGRITLALLDLREQGLDYLARLQANETANAELQKVNAELAADLQSPWRIIKRTLGWRTEQA